MMDQQNGSTNNSTPAASSSIGSGSTGGKQGARWDPKGRRNMFIVGGVIGSAILLVLLMSFLGRGAKEEGKVSAITPSKDEQTVSNGMMSTTEKAALQADEKARLDEARTKHQSAVGNEMAQSGITLPQGQNPGQTQPGTQVGNAQQLQGEQRLDQKSGPSGQGPAAAQNAPDNEKIKGLTSQMEQLMQAWGVKEGNTRQFSAYTRTGVQQTAGQNGAQSGNGAGGAIAAGQPARDPNEQPIVAAFESSYGAETLGPIDTDTPGKLRARILSGPLAGGVAMGVAKRIGTQGVQFDFNTVAYKGRLLKVSAYGVDIETSGDVVQGNYDGRYMQRYVFPIISEGVRAYATARAQTGTQVVAINLPGSGGIATGAQQTPPPTAEQARQAMIAAGANQVSTVLKAGPQDGHITLDVKTQFAIVFEEPIYQSDLTGQAAKNGK